MRRFAAIIFVATLSLAGCATTATPPAASSPVPPVAVTPSVTQTITATVQLNPALQAPSSNTPVVTGTWSDEAHGWFVADYNRLLATTDGGAHWQQVATFEHSVRGLSFVSATHGWIATNKERFVTFDGGHTMAPKAAAALPAGAVFRDEKLGWAIEQKDGTSPSFLQLTGDGGYSWSAPILTPCKPGFTADTASFVSRETGYLLCTFFQGSGGASKWLYRTDDGGAQWQLITGTIYGQPQPDFPPGIPVGVHDKTPDGALTQAYGQSTLAFLDEQHGVLTFTQGPFWGWTYTTADGGQTWQRLAMPGATNTRQSRFFTPSHGRVLVNNGQEWAWLETFDGGSTWSRLYPPLAPVLISVPVSAPTLQFQDADHGRALGSLTDPKAVLTTADGGRTWQLAGGDVPLPTHDHPVAPFPLPDGLHAIDLAQPSGDVAWALAVGDAPDLSLRLLTTTDGGRTWTQINTLGIAPIMVTAFDALHAWVTDGKGHLYRTVDGGHGWEQLR